MDTKNSDNFTVLFVGRLHPDKNVAFLIRAFKELHLVFPDSLLWIVGEGYLRHELTSLCNTLGINKAVQFFGHKPNEQLAEFYKKASVFVLPSFEETFGIVAVEAMYYGKPLIVPVTLISAPDLIDHGINGYIVDSSSEIDLAQKLILLHEDPILCEAMGRLSKLKALQFAVEPAINRIESVYEELIQL